MSRTDKDTKAEKDKPMWYRNTGKPNLNKGFGCRCPYCGLEDGYKHRIHADGKRRIAEGLRDRADQLDMQAIDLDRIADEVEERQFEQDEERRAYEYYAMIRAKERDEAWAVYLEEEVAWNIRVEFTERYYED